MTYQVASIDCDGLRSYYGSLEEARNDAALLARAREEGMPPVTVLKNFTHNLKRKSTFIAALKKANGLDDLFTHNVVDRELPSERKPARALPDHPSMKILKEKGFRFSK